MRHRQASPYSSHSIYFLKVVGFFRSSIEAESVTEMKHNINCYLWINPKWNSNKFDFIDFIVTFFGSEYDPNIICRGLMVLNDAARTLTSYIEFVVRFGNTIWKTKPF